MHKSALLSLLTVLIGCSSPSTQPDAADTGACTGTIEEVQARVPTAMLAMCPTRWEDVPSVAPCHSFAAIRAGQCGNALVYTGGCTLDSFLCAYDATTHALVGVAESTDTNSYCNRTSSCIAAGTLPDEVSCGIYGIGLRPSASDGGAVTCDPPVLPSADAATIGDASIADGSDGG
jgi:hypothetical protein